jgi:hypothetical protein
MKPGYDSESSFSLKSRCCSAVSCCKHVPAGLPVPQNELALEAHTAVIFARRDCHDRKRGVERNVVAGTVLAAALRKNVLNLLKGISIAAPTSAVATYGGRASGGATSSAPTPRADLLGVQRKDFGAELCGHLDIRAEGIKRLD